MTVFFMVQYIPHSVNLLKDKKLRAGMEKECRYTLRELKVLCQSLEDYDVYYNFFSEILVCIIQGDIFVHIQHIINNRRYGMNITLSADKGLIVKSRRYARKNNTTLNSLVRSYLSKIAGGASSSSTADEFEGLALSKAGKSPSGYKFDRDEIHER